MGAITAGVVVAAVGTAANMSAQSKQRKAAKNAARGQDRAAIESAQFLAGQGRKGEQAIRSAAITAAETASGIASDAADPLRDFARTGKTAHDAFAKNTLYGHNKLLGGISGIVDRAGMGAVDDYDLSDPVARELARKSQVSGVGAAQSANDALGSLGRMGAVAAGDIAGIEGRGFDRLSDLAANTASGRAGALVGVAPAAQQALLGAGEARALSDFADQRYNAQALESLSRLVGEVSRG